MDCYHVRTNETVLLLGEGNFSFSISLLELNLNSSTTFNNFYSTCYESNIDCQQTLENIQRIKSEGFNVVLGVDATKLSEHPVIGSMKFDKIIFNFPHIKGKMKINLNRDLIREFFVSSSEVLVERGVIILALCSGQGGTPFEKVNRKWENTWQVVEMAAHGNYILSGVESFPNDKFPQYVSSGFRGKSKSFNTQDALVHIFSRGTPPVETIDEVTLGNLTKPHPLPCNANIETSYIHAQILKKNPFNYDSPQNYFKNLLISSSKFPNTLVSSELPLISSKNDDSHVKCHFAGEEKSLRKSLVEVIPTSLSNDNHIFWGITFQKLTSNFSICPIKSEGLIIGNNVEEICSIFNNKLNNVFPNLGLTWESESDERNKKLSCKSILNETKILLEISEIDLDGESSKAGFIDFDEISLCLLQLESWKQLLCENFLFTSKPQLHFKVPCFSTQTYSFDINFITTPLFNLDSFTNLLWQIGDNMICAVLLLNTYDHSDKEKVSNCYRIVYKSYDRPLFRKRIVNFHEKVIGKSLQILYNVVIC